MANDFSSDANCVALYNLENGALTTDSKGTNTLTDDTGLSADTVNYKQGAASVDMTGTANDWLYCTDANLDSGFPAKSGESNAVFSVCFWVMFSSETPSYQYIVTKYNSSTDARSWACVLTNQDKFNLAIGYNNGDDSNFYSHLSAIDTGIWYHVGMTWNNTTKAYLIRVWDDTAGDYHGSDFSGTGSNQMSIDSAPLVLGDRGQMDDAYDLRGNLDEVVIFNDVLTTTEIDEIRAGTYSGPVTTLGLAGAVAITSSASGAITQKSLLAGTVAITSSASGAISKSYATPTTFSLAGTSAFTSSASAALSAKYKLAGTVAIAITASASLTEIPVRSLAGTVTIAFTAAGSLLARIMHVYPLPRPDTYDEDLVFDETTGKWTSDADLLAKDGSRHHTQLVSIAKDLIYYEVIT